LYLTACNDPLVAVVLSDAESKDILSNNTGAVNAVVIDSGTETEEARLKAEEIERLKAKVARLKAEAGARKRAKEEAKQKSAEKAELMESTNIGSPI
jgi:septal ring factor EnvC (AmiA/AmiB activator)